MGSLKDRLKNKEYWVIAFFAGVIAAAAILQRRGYTEEEFKERAEGYLLH